MHGVILNLKLDQLEKETMCCLRRPKFNFYPDVTVNIGSEDPRQSRVHPSGLLKKAT
jgi:hypothetical protein